MESGEQKAIGGDGVGTDGRGKHAAVDSKIKEMGSVSEATVIPFGAASGTTPHCRYTVHTWESWDAIH
jgi:hypothetical protein